MNGNKVIQFLLRILVIAVFFSSLPPTVSAQSSTFAFGAAGDYANGSNFKATVDAVAAANLSFQIALGDLSYSAGTEASWCSTWKTKFNNIILITGNHDSGESSGGNINYFIQHCPFPFAGIQGNYGHQFYFDYPEIHPIARFILLRPGIGGAGSISYNNGDEGYTFTRNAIDEARSRGIPWIVVGFHKNYITAMEKPNGIGTDLMKLLLDKKVDLILQGHEHGYERSKQLSTSGSCNTLTVNSYNPACVVDSDNSFQKGAGSIIQIIGTGGQGLRGLNTHDSEYPYFASVNNTAYGFGKFNLTDSELSYSFVRSAGGTFSDSYTISAGNNPVTPALSAAATLPVISTPSPTLTPTPTRNAQHSPTPTQKLQPTLTPSVTSPCDVAPQVSGSVLFSVSLDAGTYKIWTRVQSFGSSADSLYLQIDQGCPIVVGDTGNMAVGTWVWVDYKDGNQNSEISSVLTAGTHTITLSTKEPGVRVDRIILTKDTRCTPVAMGDNCNGTLINPTDGHKRDEAQPVAEITPIIAEHNQIPAGLEMLTAAEDGYVSKKHASKNYGASKSLHVDGSPEEISYIKFDLRSVKKKSVKSAVLNLTVSNYSRQTQTLYTSSDVKWSEKKLTYKNHPDLGAMAGKIQGGRIGDVVRVDVTNVVKKYAGRFITIALKSTKSDALYVYSKESGKNAPVITISHTGDQRSTLPVTKSPVRQKDADDND